MIIRAAFLLLLFFQLSFGQVANFKYFSAGYSDHGTDWVSYRLTKEMVEKDSSQTRPGFSAFNGWVTNDYTNTEMDRGHLLAADHMSFDLEGYLETFSLANIIPQEPKLNRRLIKEFEVYEKRLALEFECIYVIIKVVYGEEMRGKLKIPIHFVRIIQDCKGDIIAEHKFYNI